MASRTIGAALVYFAIVFAIGFLIGAVRVMLVEPRLGPAVAVALELPIMLAVSWLVARSIVARLAIPRATAERLGMGLSALVMLVAAETALGAMLGQPVSAQLASYASLRGLFTLLGQLGFALIPLLV